MNRDYDKEQLREALDNFLLAVPGHELASGRVALTCTLYFRNAHLPEVQEAVCKCAKEYIALIGPEAKSAISGSPARFHLAKNGKVTPPRVSTFRKAQEKGRPTAMYRVFSHASGAEFDSLPPTFALYIYMQLNQKYIFSLPMERMTSVFSAVFAPSFFLLDRGFEEFSALVHKWCDALRPHSGAAGWGISTHCNEMNSFVTLGLPVRELLRYPGLDYPALPFFPEDTNRFESNIASINWLTILCDELAERIGGEASLRALGEGYPLRRYDGGYIIQAGPEPELGDRDEGDFLPQYGKVHDLLRSLYPPLEKLTYLATNVFDYNPYALKVNSDCSRKEILHKFFKSWMDRYAPDNVTIPPLFRVSDPKEDEEETSRGPEDEEATRRLEEEWRQKAAAQFETFRAALAAAKRCRESDGRPD
ncbi:MAG TPA: DUF3396 domain-containing protein [Candidatus Desulfovibrio intestinigallinarum]|nr:DUF3396 domain-containing protein [Candidatus Desulfovibrio intestinigallinarum]